MSLLENSGGTDDVADSNHVLDYAKIRTLREKSKLTMDQCAISAGFASRQRWYEIETGRKTNVTIDTLYKIAKALGCKPADLLK